MPVPAEGPRDHSSTLQLLADSKAVHRLCQPQQPETLYSTLQAPSILEGGEGPNDLSDQLRLGHSLLDDAEPFLTSQPTHKSGEETVPVLLNTICKVLHILAAALPPSQGDPATVRCSLALLDLSVQSGQTQPPKKRRGDFRLMAEYMDAFTDSSKLRLLRRSLLFVGQLTKMNLRARSETSEPQAPTDGKDAPSEEGRIIDLEPYRHIVRWLASTSHELLSSITALGIWVKLLFLQEWDGNPSLEAGKVPIACQLLMAACKEAQLFGPSWDVGEGEGHLTPYTIDNISAQVDAVTMARTWLQYQAGHDSQTMLHLLGLPMLVANQTLPLYFRTINHLRMQYAHSKAEEASTLRGRTVQSTYDVDADTRLLFLEDHYLLLNIGRSSVVHDSFNQIWQRRSSELLRPLRVRLGEMDTFEVGHDLGGVQIEFFNLLCKEIMSDELGMFTSDPGSGRCYFKPGCLQPLYMFELFGLLIALAIYNGITLPVSFPLILYTRLGALGCDGISSIEDGWPEMFRSLSAIQEHDVPGLPYAFMVEANGVRLSLSSVELAAREDCKITARVTDATSIVHHPTYSMRLARTSLGFAAPHPDAVDLRALRWPGWIFEPAPDNEPDDVTQENKADYLDQYVTFLTYGCVAPQLHHFLKGFHRIIPAAQLCFLTAQQLRAVVEGTRELSIFQLRSVTTYEGYMPHGPYISCFWSIVESWPEAKQKQLLKFVTAAERLPAGGAKDVVFKIARVSHPDAEMELPTSSTCFGTLNLPKYPSRQVLEHKLTIALEMGLEGFGTG